jgi:hypothetical protein
MLINLKKLYCHHTEVSDVSMLLHLEELSCYETNVPDILSIKDGLTILKDIYYKDYNSDSYDESESD